MQRKCWISRCAWPWLPSPTSTYLGKMRVSGALVGALPLRGDRPAWVAGAGGRRAAGGHFSGCLGAAFQLSLDSGRPGLWFLIMALPIIGLIPGGNQLVADRYTYLTQIGLVGRSRLGGWKPLRRLVKVLQKSVARVGVAALVLLLFSAVLASRRLSGGTARRCGGMRWQRHLITRWRMKNWAAFLVIRRKMPYGCPGLCLGPGERMPRRKMNTSRPLALAPEAIAGPSAIWGGILE